MYRYALKIEYAGTGFAGWQRQSKHSSVQQCLEEALRKLDPELPNTVAAGRTDSGVHATGQVAHCDLQKEWEPFRLAEAVNGILRPHPIAIVQAAPVERTFSARFSAIERTYKYRIAVRRAPLTLQRDKFWHVRAQLDVSAMKDGAGHLVGHHDFTTFRSSQCQSGSPVKSLDELTVEALPMNGGFKIVITAKARSFLHRQVRSMVGTLERVGAGAMCPEEVRAALESRDRRECGPVAPPQGLCLTNVRYDPDPFTLAEPAGPSAWGEQRQSG